MDFALKMMRFECKYQKDHFHHLFLPNARLWAHDNATSALGPAAQKELETRICRLFNPSSTELTGEGTLRYWEASVGGTPLYPSAIKFVIGNFPDLFGTPAGQVLREWYVLQAFHTQNAISY